MFSNVGKKLMSLAVILFVVSMVGILGSIIILLDGEDFGVYILISSIVSAISTWILYAFGQVTEDVSKIRKCLENQNKETYTDLPPL